MKPDETTPPVNSDPSQNATDPTTAAPSSVPGSATPDNSGETNPLIPPQGSQSAITVAPPETPTTPVTPTTPTTPTTSAAPATPSTGIMPKPVAPTAPQPVVPNTAQQLTDLYNKYGITGMQNQLNDIANQKAAAADALSAFKLNQNPIAGETEEGYTARVSEAERNAQERSDFYDRQSAALNSRLTTANSYVTQLMSATKTDYTNAEASWNDGMTKYMAAQTEYNTEATKEQNEAAAALTSIQNMISTNNLSWDAVSPAMKASIQTEEIKAGWMPGMTEALARSNPKAGIVSSTPDPIGDGTIDVVMKDPTTNSLYMVKVSPTVGGTNPTSTGTGANNGTGYDGSILATANADPDPTKHVDPQAIVSDVLKNPSQVTSLISAMTAAEGGTSAAGSSVNNPLDLKYTPAMAAWGATDSGIHASDGGTFAAFPDAATARQAYIKQLSQPGYANLTVDQALQKWSGSGSSATSGPKALGTTGSPTINASAPGYSTTPIAGGITQSAIDSLALQYALTGTMPSLGYGSTAVTAAKRNAIINRAGEIDSGGNFAANKATLTANSTALTQQVTYLNNTQRAFSTANDTLASLTSWMSSNGIDPTQFPDANSFINYLNSKGIDPGAAGGYNAQIATLRQEYSQVLAKGGVRSAETDAEAAQLIPDGLAPAQLQTVAARIKVDANNAIGDAQGQVTSIQNTINGIISPQSQFKPNQTYYANGTSFRISADGKTATDASGTVYDIGSDGLTPQ